MWRPPPANNNNNNNINNGGGSYGNQVMYQNPAMTSQQPGNGFNGNGGGGSVGYYGNSGMDEQGSQQYHQMNTNTNYDQPSQSTSTPSHPSVNSVRNNPDPRENTGRPSFESGSTMINHRTSMGVSLPVKIVSNGLAQPQVSLFQTCMNLIETLYSFPLFEFYLFPEGEDIYMQPDSPLIEPVSVLWATFRLGAPLCMIYNQLQPKSPLNVSDVSSVIPGSYGKVCKDNVFHFIIACRKELELPEAQDFQISELYKDDTNGFMKMLKIIQALMQRIETAGLMPPKRRLPIPIPNSTPGTILDDPTATNKNRVKVLQELVDTERAYIFALEELQRYQDTCSKDNVLSREYTQALFANLNEMLDFQRRFMIHMESVLVLPTNEQHIGALFINNEQTFEVYHTFCSNYQFATKLVLSEMETLKKLAHIIEPIQLQSYLIKPVQRICKYPLLLQELIKLTDPETYPFMDELKDGLASIKRVTEKVNEEERLQHMELVRADLMDRVEEWRSLNPAEFGSLILSDKFYMRTSDQDHEFKIYLFENILLCCKDTGKSLKKGNRKASQILASTFLPNVTIPNISSRIGGVADPTIFVIKGHIKIHTIYKIEDVSHPNEQKFGLQVSWSDGKNYFPFVLKARNGEQVKLWKERLERQTKTAADGSASNIVVVAASQPQGVVAAAPRPPGNYTRNNSIVSAYSIGRSPSQDGGSMSVMSNNGEHGPGSMPNGNTGFQQLQSYMQMQNGQQSQQQSPAVNMSRSRSMGGAHARDGRRDHSFPIEGQNGGVPYSPTQQQSRMGSVSGPSNTRFGILENRRPSQDAIMASHQQQYGRKGSRDHVVEEGGYPAMPGPPRMHSIDMNRAASPVTPSDPFAIMQAPWSEAPSMPMVPPNKFLQGPQQQLPPSQQFQQVPNNNNNGARSLVDEINSKIQIERKMLQAAQAMTAFLADGSKAALECQANIQDIQKRLFDLEEQRARAMGAQQPGPPPMMMSGPSGNNSVPMGGGGGGSVPFYGNQPPFPQQGQFGSQSMPIKPYSPQQMASQISVRQNQTNMKRSNSTGDLVTLELMNPPNAIPAMPQMPNPQMNSNRMYSNEARRPSHDGMSVRPAWGQSAPLMPPPSSFQRPNSGQGQYPMQTQVQSMGGYPGPQQPARSPDRGVYPQSVAAGPYPPMQPHQPPPQQQFIPPHQQNMGQQQQQQYPPSQQQGMAQQQQQQYMPQNMGAAPMNQSQLPQRLPSNPNPSMNNPIFNNNNGGSIPMTPLTPTTAGGPLAIAAGAPRDAFIKVKAHHLGENYVIAISTSRGASIQELFSRVDRKMRLCGAQISPAGLSLACRLDGSERLPNEPVRQTTGDGWIVLQQDVEVAGVFSEVLRVGRDRVLNVYVL